ncbi:hypothetical protein [Streptomyces tendae]|uniref:hypothetical protein n=1 Tax=Streptomyces tendae TaxID=1932 RepID=UPI0011734F32
MVGVPSTVAVVATLLVHTLRLSGPGSCFVILVAALGDRNCSSRDHDRSVMAR